MTRQVGAYYFLKQGKPARLAVILFGWTLICVVSLFPGIGSASSNPTPIPGIKDAEASGTPVPHEAELESKSTSPIQNSSNGHWYEVSDLLVNWNTANTYASNRTYEGLQGHLATITTAQENAWLVSFLDPYNQYWLGGYQPSGSSEPDGDWRWVTGETWSYSNWVYEEPNDDNGGEDYLVFWPFQSGWNDGMLDTLMPFVIEYEGDIPTPTPTSTLMPTSTPTQEPTATSTPTFGPTDTPTQTPSPTPRGDGKVAGYILDAWRLETLSEAILALDDQFAYPNEEGRFLFENIQHGPNQISAIAVGYEFYTQTVEVGGATLLLVELAPRGSAPSADVNFDGVVDGKDLLTVKANWKKMLPGHALQAPVQKEVDPRPELMEKLKKFIEERDRR